MHLKYKYFTQFLHERGVPLVYFRDRATKKSSVSLTLMIISFTLCVAGIIGKAAHFWEINEPDAFNLFLACAGLYFGRRVTTKSGTIEDAKVITDNGIVDVRKQTNQQADLKAEQD
jgi:hypothetical protein